jgi:DNA-binding PadR family transcriptional regulator
MSNSTRSACALGAKGSVTSSNGREAGGDYQTLYSGLIRLHILYHACQGAIFGLEMIEELSRHGYHIGPGTLYPILHEMEAREWLRSERKLVGGRIRRVYRATPSGRRALVAAKGKVLELFGELFESERAVRQSRRGARPQRKRVPQEEL